jgi:hypothetical protein
MTPQDHVERRAVAHERLHSPNLRAHEKKLLELGMLVSSYFLQMRQNEVGMTIGTLARHDKVGM